MKKVIVDWIVNIDDNEIIKRSTFWNFVSSMINAGYSAILMFFIGRYIGINEVGIFSIASAYAYQCMTIGVFGVRNVQASDVTKEYTFSDYFFLRIVSGIGMYGLLLYYTFFQGFSMDKLAIVFVFGIFKSIEAIEDLYHGEYQRYNRLDIGCILQATRYIISLIVFVVLLVCSKQVILSFTISTLLTMILCYFQNISIIKQFVHEKIKLNIQKVKKLFFICLPICVSSYIGMYIVNLPKYAIAEISNDLMQSHYGILILPVVTINLLSAVIYRPVVNTLSKNYYEYSFKKFFHLIYKQVLIIGVLTLVIILGGYILGLRLLEILYNVKLSSYMLAFIVMLIGGGVNTVSLFFTIVLTVQRGQVHLLVAYALTLLVGIPIAIPLISTMGIMGAAILYLILSGSMSLILICFIYLKYKMFKGAYV